uniref:Uncharacterized protein n=1 Tax=Tanacetum cinerariifolium TaxID=118510 RepID=A0A6L2L0B9_TANCI|nr:hypothetical protein [Tanacetum cinerariifolium]
MYECLHVMTRQFVVMIPFLVVPRVSALVGCERLVSEPGLMFQLVLTKEGIVIKLPGKFCGYKLATEEEVEENEGLKEVTNISQIDKNKAKRTKPSMGMERA